MSAKTPTAREALAALDEAIEVYSRTRPQTEEREAALAKVEEARAVRREARAREARARSGR